MCVVSLGVFGVGAREIAKTRFGALDVLHEVMVDEPNPYSCVVDKYRRLICNGWVRDGGGLYVMRNGRFVVDKPLPSWTKGVFGRLFWFDDTRLYTAYILQTNVGSFLYIDRCTETGCTNVYTANGVLGFAVHNNVGAAYLYHDAGAVYVVPGEYEILLGFRPWSLFNTGRKIYYQRAEYVGTLEYVYIGVFDDPADPASRREFYSCFAELGQPRCAELVTVAVDVDGRDVVVVRLGTGEYVFVDPVTGGVTKDVRHPVIWEDGSGFGSGFYDRVVVHLGGYPYGTYELACVPMHIDGRMFASLMNQAKDFAFYGEVVEDAYYVEGRLYGVVANLTDAVLYEAEVGGEKYYVILQESADQQFAKVSALGRISSRVWSRGLFLGVY